MDRPINSDELGEKGEKRFAELCADARLIANASTRDRAGWDYIVDFKLEGATGRLDARPAPASARVQVKTQWADNSIIKLRLSSAELLAKHPGPSFICVLAVNPDLTFRNLRILHCRGELLARILKHLRRAEASGKNPSQVEIAIRPSRYVDPAPCTGEALRKALEGDCTGDALAYFGAKRLELDQLGFEDNARAMSGQLRGTEEAIVDALLGLTTIEAEILKTTETRFGITLPTDDGLLGAGLLEFKPRPERSELIFHDRAAGRRFTFKARTYRLPPAVFDSISKPKVVFRTDQFDFSLTTQRGELEVTVAFVLSVRGEALLDARLKPAEWRNLYGALSSLIGQGLDVEIRSRGLPTLTQKLPLDAGDPNPEWHVLARLANSAADLFSQAGCPNAKLSVEDLWAARSDITTAAALLSEAGTVTGVNFVTSADMELPLDPAPPMMFAHVFRVGPHLLSYAARIDLKGEAIGDEVHWQSGPPDLLGIRRVTSETSLHAWLRTLPGRLEYRIITGFYSDESAKVTRRTAS